MQTPDGDPLEMLAAQLAAAMVAGPIEGETVPIDRIVDWVFGRYGGAKYETHLTLEDAGWLAALIAEDEGATRDATIPCDDGPE